MTDKEDTVMTMAAPVTPERDVWIGSLASAQHKQFLKKQGIKSILNVSGIEPLPHTKRMYKEEKIDYHTFTEIDPDTKEEKFMPDAKFDDMMFTKSDFLNYAAKAMRIIKNAPKPILVNCQMGMNRSAAMIAAYLICVRGYKYHKAVDALETANKPRGLGALKNGDFRKMLKEMSRFCKHERKRKGV
jgi:protein tyrosine/serine phosphatase